MRVCGEQPDIGDWFLLYFANQEYPEGLPCDRSPLLPGGFDAGSRDWVFYGQKIQDDRGDEPARHPLGAATPENIDWGKRVAAASSFPMSAQADAATLRAVLGPIRRANKIVVRDVGQASFCWLKDVEDRVILYYDVGWPLPFNRKTAPPRFTIDFTRVPVVLSHWDWDHLHYALRPEGRHLKECSWIVPIQKLGPGAAWFANELSKKGKLLGWRASVLSTTVGSIGPCNASPDNTNNSGLAMIVSLLSGQSILLVGDADYEFLPGALKGPIDGMVVTHHGARFASSWTAIPKPNRAHSKCIVSYGKGNSYGHPHEDAIDKHNSAGWRQIIPTAAFKGVARSDREFR
jgi:competence protein ComEC